MTTVQQIYDMAIHLMDEQNEQTGGTQTVDTNEYRYRTISILNSVIPSLYIYSDNYVSRKEGKRGVPSALYAEDYQNPDFEQAIPLDDILSLSLLPYYLAAQLLSGENGDLASWFMGRYREAFMEVRNKIPASFEPVNTPYGLF
jgi:hypothetical protein